MYDASIPITELTNEFSSKLDGSSSSDDFLRILRAVDAQVFTGWREYSSLFDFDLLQQCERVAQSCAKLIRLCMSGRDVAIVMTGCGTSGRVAYLTARRFNQALRSIGVTKLAFYYLISGGDSALLLSDELPEDDPVEGASDLEAIIKKYGQHGYFLIGVTCGLSAPYVAGQLDYAIRDIESSKKSDGSYTIKGVAVLGFNPPNMARNAPIEKAQGHWAFRDVALQLEELRLTEQVGVTAAHEGCTYATLTPVVGPEPVGGSSRMKGGSATVVVLDTVCRRALLLATSIDSDSCQVSTIEDMYLAFQQCHSKTYATACCPPQPLPSTIPSGVIPAAETGEYSLCRVMESAALALRDNCRLYYVGTGSAGCMGCIDVSEMPDTYGSPFDQVRAFVSGGWTVVGNMDGDLSHMSRLHCISTEHFRTDILSNLRKNDAIVFVLSDADDVSIDVLDLALDIQRSGLGNMCLVRAARTSRISSSVSQMANMTAGRYVNVNLGSNAHDGLLDYSIKLLLNAVSTFAQASGRGAVYKGMMVSTGPANDKIYARCVRLLADSFPGVSLVQAEHALIKAIHGVDELHADLLNKPRSFHIQASILPPDERHCAQIALPLAMLLLANEVSGPCMEKWTVASGRNALVEEPRIGIILRNVFSRQSSASNNLATTTTESLPLKPQGDAVVFDLGGTHLRGSLAVNGEIITSISCVEIGSDKSIAAVMSIIADLYRSVLNSKPQSFFHSCVVLAQPGRVDTEKGTVSALSNYPWEGDVPMRELLGQIVNDNSVDILLMDDANAALLGEVHASGFSLTDTVCMLTVGTGVGSSVCLQGEILTGRRGLIEGGHQIVVLDGRYCSCGQRGCLEAYASGPAVSRIAYERGLRLDGGIVTTEQVVSAARLGNQAALTTLKDASRYLAVACLNMVRLYDPKAVVIGGGFGVHLVDDVRRDYKELSWTLHDDLADVDIVAAKCSEPGIVGAGVYAGVSRWNRSMNM